MLVSTVSVLLVLAIASVASPTASNAQGAAATPAGPVATAQPGQNVSFGLLPKFVGNPVFEEANQGAQEAMAELKSSGKYQFVGPDKADVQQQIEFIKSLTTQGMNVIAISA